MKLKRWSCWDGVGGGGGLEEEIAGALEGIFMGVVINLFVLISSL